MGVFWDSAGFFDVGAEDGGLVVVEVDELDVALGYCFGGELTGVGYKLLVNRGPTGADREG